MSMLSYPIRNSDDEKARFSTGFLKVTPAHDPDDWEIGQRHGLEVINVMAPDGSISDKFGWKDANSPEAQALLGLDRFEAREAIVEWFRQENLLEDVREYAMRLAIVIAAMSLSSRIFPTNGISLLKNLSSILQQIWSMVLSMEPMYRLIRLLACSKAPSRWTFEIYTGALCENLSILA